VVVVGLVAFLVVTWARSFGLPLGDSHEGRIMGQFALHVRNFWDLGPSASSFGGVVVIFNWRRHASMLSLHSVIIAWTRCCRRHMALSLLNSVI
jgi:hypothetical protein